MMPATSGPAIVARRVRIRGVVQGVGFRPFVYRIARARQLCGTVANGDDGVRIHVEGPPDDVEAFIRELSAAAPPAARISSIEIEPCAPRALDDFCIASSASGNAPTVAVSPDLPVCDACLRELFTDGDRRAGYAYTNCTNCGPRFSIVTAMPYDRAHTTMAEWSMCEACRAEYAKPGDRRFHAQPVACAACGPQYVLESVMPGVTTLPRDAVLRRGRDAIRETARLLCEGQIIAVKGIGGYHLSCDADNAAAVAALRTRKFRKEKAFAVMVRDARVAARTVHLDDGARALLESVARPIVLARARCRLDGVAPDSDDLGVMLPYTPLHHLLFAAGAPERLVMTSGNRSSEPIAYRDEAARWMLAPLADAILVGERAIARRVDDSVVRPGACGTMVIRRSRGLAPAAAAAFPTMQPILAVGADLKNAVTLVVNGEAYVGQHIGDLSNHDCLRAFEESIADLVGMYGLSLARVTIVHDSHPEYASTHHARAIAGARTIAVQHHRAHIASVVAERGAFDTRVVGVAFDGTGYGDDGAIWGGEIFAGSVRGGFERVAHLRPAVLPGGDAAARHPLHAAAGFLAGLVSAAEMEAFPFCFSGRYAQACAVAQSGVRTFPTTSAGRLFDAAAAICGFTRPITFEGQAAMWLEHLARRGDVDALDLRAPFASAEIDWRELLTGMIEARRRGVRPATVARAFHRALADATAAAIRGVGAASGIGTAALSGGVFQNAMLLDDLRAVLASSGIDIWMNTEVPPNDGGLSLGQAALGLAAIEGR